MNRTGERTEGATNNGAETLASLRSDAPAAEVAATRRAGQVPSSSTVVHEDLLVVVASVVVGLHIRFSSQVWGV